MMYQGPIVTPPPLSERLDNLDDMLVTESEIHKVAVKRRDAGEDIILLTVADQEAAPAQTLAACIEAIEKDSISAQAPFRLHRAMAAISSRSTGLETSESQVLAFPSGQFALYAALQAIADPGSHAVMFAPYYQTYHATLRAAGTAVSIVETRPQNDFQPERGSMEQALRSNTCLILINTPNNPTGATYSRKTLEDIAEICLRHNLWLVSDEVYWSLADAPISPRALPGMADRTVVVNSMSKSHGIPSWHIGWITGPETLITRLKKLRAITAGEIPTPLLKACVAALENDYGVHEIIDRHAARRAAVLQALRQMGKIKLRGTAAGGYLMIDIREIEPDCGAFAWKLLEAEQVAVMPGSFFGDAAKGHLRLSLGQPKEILREAMHRLGRFVRQYPAKQGLS
ncbi:MULTISPECIES: pyridoxal phosphate-dependent aminotransferase [unclassified Sinorhizobium]|uniref:pyridoxal phosphate-dependent aminotransferase n=1 Tax=unclassified Sinorhizobium TaxID=2613772 RepID=UPI0035240338